MSATSGITARGCWGGRTTISRNWSTASVPAGEIRPIPRGLPACAAQAQQTPRPHTRGGFPAQPGVNAAAAQAAMPFTAPCAAAVVGPPFTNGSGGPFNPGNKCFSYLSYITIVNNSYTSNYNGLQATLTGRNYHGVSFTAGYTYSHSLGLASDQGTSGNFPIAINSYGNIRSQLYGSSDFDVRHRGTLSVSYNLPGRTGMAP